MHLQDKDFEIEQKIFLRVWHCLVLFDLNYEQKIGRLKNGCETMHNCNSIFIFHGPSGRSPQMAGRSFW